MSAWASDARADCKSDSECKGDRTCEKGSCVSPPAPAAMPPSAPPPPSVAPPAEAAPPADAVPVAIAGRAGDHVRLDGKTSLDCRVPCRVTLSPGRYTMLAKGFQQDVDIPHNRASRIEMNRGCSVCVALGGILAGAGLPFIIGGGALVAGATGTESRTGGPAYTYTVEEEQVAGIALLISGAVMTTTGLVLLIVGLAKGPDSVTVNGETASAPATKPEAPALGVDARGVVIRF
ncbi:MAG: hypothetical protein KF819_09885 [Labilithrix sp.]|nr:hypothetical protein [Labilithrix sp.]